MKNGDTLLDDWPQFNKAIMDMTRRQIARLLRVEATNRKRVPFLLRLHSRLNKLRYAEEREILMRGQYSGDIR